MCLLLAVLPTTRAKEADALILEQRQIAAGGHTDLQGGGIILVGEVGGGKHVAVWGGQG